MSDERRRQFGANVRRHRKAAGFESQEALARHLGLSVFTINRYETGRQQPDFDTLYRLADALACDPGDLLPEAA